MNPWQMAQQIKHKLTTVAWTVGATDVVFGTRGVHVFAGRPTEEQIPAGFPWALVGIDGGNADPDHPEFITQTYSILSAADVAGDPMGEQAIIGGSAANLGKSVGRGVGEIAERIRSAVGDLVGSDGSKVLLSLTSTGSPTPIGRGRHLVLDEHTLTALCTSSLHYAAPQHLALTSGSADAWTWQGAHCSDRFDFIQYRFYEHTSIMTGPGAAASGTPVLVYTGTSAAATRTKVTGRYYHVFADYASRKQSGVIEGNSSVEVGSYRVGA